MVYRIFLYILSVFMTIFLLSCHDDDPVSHDTGITVQNARTSECGGFSSLRMAVSADTTLQETLSWKYDSAAGIIEFTNSHVQLNCCGKHSITASLEDGTIVISESDQPTDNGRCKCLCLFDFAIDVMGTFGNVLTVRLQRTVDTALDMEKTFEIDLSKTSGNLTVK